MSARQYTALNWGFALALLLLLAAPRAVSVSADGERVLLPGGRAIPELCLTKRTTGQECGSCHLGRSVVLAAQGDVSRSLTHHAGGIVLVGWAALQALVRLVMAVGFAGLARYWWVDVTVTLATLTLAAVGIAFSGR